MLSFCTVAVRRLLRTRLGPGPISRLCVAILTVATASGCGNGPKLLLRQQVEARRLASDIRVQLNKAADASNQTVMTVTDEASSAAAREAEQATQAVDRDVQALQPILEALAYRDEIQHLSTFKTCFAGYRTLEADILPLAVENTNIKAQHLSFGTARDAVTSFRQSLEAARSMTTKNTYCVDALIAKALAAVLEVQV